MQKNILLFILFALPIRTFAFDLQVKKENSVLASTDSNKARTYPMLRFSYYLSWGLTNPAGSFGSLRKQNTTAYLQGYDGFGANRGIIFLYTGFYFYLKKLPLPANQKIGINWTLLDVNFTTLGRNRNEGVFASFSSNPGIIYSYCPRKHLALDAMANACFTRVSGFGNRRSSIVMQEIGLAMRLRFLYVSISFKNGRVNGSFDGDTSPDDDYTEQPLIVTPTSISEMSFRVNYFSLRLGVCF